MTALLRRWTPGHGPLLIDPPLPLPCIIRVCCGHESFVFCESPPVVSLEKRQGFNFLGFQWARLARSGSAAGVFCGGSILVPFSRRPKMFLFISAKNKTLV